MYLTFWYGPPWQVTLKGWFYIPHSDPFSPSFQWWRIAPLKPPSPKAPETTRTHAIRYCQVFLPWRAAMNSGPQTALSSGQDTLSAATNVGVAMVSHSTDFYGQYPLRSRRILCHCVRAHFEWTKSHIIEKRTSQNRSTQNHPISESCSWNCWDHLTWCPCETWHTSCIQEAKHILHQQTPP